MQSAAHMIGCWIVFVGRSCDLVGDYAATESRAADGGCYLWLLE